MLEEEEEEEEGEWGNFSARLNFITCVETQASLLNLLRVVMPGSRLYGEWRYAYPTRH